MWRVKSNLYCMSFNRVFKTLVYRTMTKSISVISILPLDTEIGPYSLII